MGTKYGFTIEAGLTSYHLTDAQYVKGGFFVVKDKEELNRYCPITYNDDGTINQDGTIVKGSLCYCQADGKFYQYDDKIVDDKVVGWVEKNFSGGGSVDGGVPLMLDVDNAEKDQPEYKNRKFVQPLLSQIQAKQRAYVNKDSLGRVNPYYNLELNAENGSARLFHPAGYSDLDTMVSNEKWEGIAIQNGVHYKTIKGTDGSLSYHPRLNAIALRSIEGNLRTGTPRDSTDCINKEYANRFLTKDSSTIKNIGGLIEGLRSDVGLLEGEIKNLDKVGEWIIAQQDPAYIGNYIATTYNSGVYEWVVMMRRPPEGEYWYESGICIFDPTIFANAQGGVETTTTLGDSGARLKQDCGAGHLTLTLEIDWANSVPVETAVLKMRKIRDV